MAESLDMSICYAANSAASEHKMRKVVMHYPIISLHQHCHYIIAIIAQTQIATLEFREFARPFDETQNGGESGR